MKTEVTLREAFELYRTGAKVWVSRPVPFLVEKTYFEITPPVEKHSYSEAWFNELMRLEKEGVTFPLNYWTVEND